MSLEEERQCKEELQVSNTSLIISSLEFITAAQFDLEKLPENGSSIRSGHFKERSKVIANLSRTNGFANLIQHDRSLSRTFHG